MPTITTTVAEIPTETLGVEASTLAVLERVLGLVVDAMGAARARGASQDALAPLQDVVVALKVESAAIAAAVLAAAGA